MQKSRGYSKPKAVKILKELEEKGLIIKVYQKGKPSKIYLVQNEYTEFAQESMKNHKKDKQHKKVAPRKIAKQKEIINEVGVDEEVTEVIAEPSMPVVEYSEHETIFDVFKAIIGREPDNSFKKCIARRAREMNLTAQNMRNIIELAQKARNPEAYILSLIKPDTYQQIYQQKQPEPVKDAPLEDWELDWLDELNRYEQSCGNYDQTIHQEVRC